MLHRDSQISIHKTTYKFEKLKSTYYLLPGYSDKPITLMSIIENLRQIKEAIRSEAIKHGRQADTVQLIAVSKTKPVEMIREAFEAGQMHFGENKVQELTEKYELLPEVKWHLIGTLQRNKVKYIASFVYLIHSVDSEKLLAEINKQGKKHDRIIDCLLQLNISEESSKSGLDEERAAEILKHIEDYPYIGIKGLMGMAEFTEDCEVIRRQFRRLQKALKMLKNIEHERIDLKELSMGMSGDYEIAIAEGATMVRIGSAVFGARN